MLQQDGTLVDVVLTALYHISAFDAPSAVKRRQLVPAMREVQKACYYNKELYNTYSDLCNQLANHRWLGKTNDARWFFIKSAQNKIAIASKMLGHANLNTTMTYIHKDLDVKKEAVKKFTSHMLALTEYEPGTHVKTA